MLLIFTVIIHRILNYEYRKKPKCICVCVCSYECVPMYIPLLLEVAGLGGWWDLNFGLYDCSASVLSRLSSPRKYLVFFQVTILQHNRPAASLNLQLLLHHLSQVSLGNHLWSSVKLACFLLPPCHLPALHRVSHDLNSCTKFHISVS